MKKKSFVLGVLLRVCVKSLLVLLLGFMWKQYSQDGELYNFSDHILPVFAIFFAAWAWLRYRHYDSTICKSSHPYHAFGGGGLIAFGMSKQLSKDPQVKKDLQRSLYDWNNDDILYCSRQWSDVICSVLCILPYLIQTFL